MKLEYCKTISESYNPDEVMVVQINTTGPDINNDDINSISVCTMSGMPVCVGWKPEDHAEDINKAISKYRALIGVDVFELLLPFCKKAGIKIECDSAADIQKEWDEVVGSYDAKTQSWKKANLISMASSFGFAPLTNDYDANYTRVFSYKYLAEKASEINTLSLRNGRKTELVAYQRATAYLKKMDSIF